ncbi:MAG: DUF4440 domain-containing protein [Bacteroidota bacterium]
MKRLISITLPFVTACILFSACQENLTDSRKAEIEKELLALTSEVQDRFNNRDTATVYTYYCDDFSLMSRGKYKISTPEEFNKFTFAAKVSIATRDQTVYDFINPVVEIYSYDVANITFLYTSTTTFENDVAFETASACTWTVIRKDGKWKIKHAHISAGEDTHRAVQGEPAFITLNTVAAEKREVFEQFIYEVMYESMIESGGLNEQVISTTRMFNPVRANEDGSYTYVFMADPVIPGVSYYIMHYLEQMYGEEEAKEKMKMFTESLVEPQTFIELTQSKY